MHKLVKRGSVAAAPIDRQAEKLRSAAHSDGIDGSRGGQCPAVTVTASWAHRYARSGRPRELLHAPDGQAVPGMRTVRFIARAALMDVWAFTSAIFGTRPIAGPP
jgi:hypothetical protein